MEKKRMIMLSLGIFLVGLLVASYIPLPAADGQIGEPCGPRSRT